jgi:CBS domain-containing protein
MLVRDVMSTALSAARVDDTVQTAARLMRDHDVGAVLVADAGGRPIGLLTDRDIVVRCVAEGMNPASCRVEELLRGHLITVEADSPLEYASRLMARHRVRRLPVTRDGRIIGMISLGDLAVREPEKQTVAATLEQVSASPRRTSKSREQAGIAAQRKAGK